jgi:hypothetical protein
LLYPVFDHNPRNSLRQTGWPGDFAPLLPELLGISQVVLRTAELRQLLEGLVNTHSRRQRDDRTGTRLGVVRHLDAQRVCAGMPGTPIYYVPVPKLVDLPRPHASVHNPQNIVAQQLALVSVACVDAICVAALSPVLQMLAKSVPFSRLKTGSTRCSNAFAGERVLYNGLIVHDAHGIGPAEHFTQRALLHVQGFLGGRFSMIGETAALLLVSPAPVVDAPTPIARDQCLGQFPDLVIAEICQPVTLGMLLIPTNTLGNAGSSFGPVQLLQGLAFLDPPQGGDFLELHFLCRLSGAHALLELVILVERDTLGFFEIGFPSALLHTGEFVALQITHAAHMDAHVPGCPFCAWTHEQDNLAVLGLNIVGIRSGHDRQASM